MEKRIKTVMEYVFTQEEAAVIEHALDYVHHRQKKHQKAGHVHSGMLEKIRTALRSEKYAKPFVTDEW